MLEKVPLSLSIIGIRDLKYVIHPLVNHVPAAFFPLFIDGCTFPIVIWVGSGITSIGGS